VVESLRQRDRRGRLAGLELSPKTNLSTKEKVTCAGMKGRSALTKVKKGERLILRRVTNGKLTQQRENPKKYTSTEGKKNYEKVIISYMRSSP